MKLMKTFDNKEVHLDKAKIFDQELVEKIRSPSIINF